MYKEAFPLFNFNVHAKMSNSLRPDLLAAGVVIILNFILCCVLACLSTLKRRAYRFLAYAVPAGALLGLGLAAFLCKGTRSTMVIQSVALIVSSVIFVRGLIFKNSPRRLLIAVADDSPTH